MSVKICWYIDNIQIERKGTRKKRKFTVIDNGIRNTHSTNFFYEAKCTAYKHLRKTNKLCTED